MRRNKQVKPTQKNRRFSRKKRPLHSPTAFAAKVWGQTKAAEKSEFNNRHMDVAGKIAFNAKRVFAFNPRHNVERGHKRALRP